MTYPARGTGPRMSRRTLMAALPATGGALFASQGGAQSLHAPTDPVVKHYRDWLAARREWRRLIELEDHMDWDTPEVCAAKDKETDAENAMFNLPPTSCEGIGALAAILWTYAGPSAAEHTPDFEYQAEYEEARLIRAIWTACTGHGGYPEV